MRLERQTKDRLGSAAVAVSVPLYGILRPAEHPWSSKAGNNTI